MKQKQYKIRVLEDGRVVVEDEDLKKGQMVDVSIFVSNPSTPTWPLRGLPVRYHDPFLGIDESEWESPR